MAKSNIVILKSKLTGLCCIVCNKSFEKAVQTVIVVDPYKVLVCLECASAISAAYDKDI